MIDRDYEDYLTILASLRFALEQGAITAAQYISAGNAVNHAVNDLKEMPYVTDMRIGQE